MSLFRKSLFSVIVSSLSVSAAITYGSITLAPNESLDLDYIHTKQEVLSEDDFSLVHNNELSLTAPALLFETLFQPYWIYDTEDYIGLNDIPASLEDSLLFLPIHQYKGEESFVGIFSAVPESERMVITTDRGYTAVLQFSDLEPVSDFDPLNPDYSSITVSYWIGLQGDFDKISSTFFINLENEQSGEIPGLDWNRIHFSDGTIFDKLEKQYVGAMHHYIQYGWTPVSDIELFRDASEGDTCWESRVTPPTNYGPVDTIMGYNYDPAVGMGELYDSCAAIVLYETMGDEMPAFFPRYAPVVRDELVYAETETGAVFKFSTDEVVLDTAYGPLEGDLQIDVSSYTLKWAVCEAPRFEFPSAGTGAASSVRYRSIPTVPLSLMVLGDQLKLSHSFPTAALELFTPSGRLLHTAKVHGDSSTLPSLATGIYHYRIRTDSAMYRGNLFVQ